MSERAGGDNGQGIASREGASVVARVSGRRDGGGVKGELEVRSAGGMLVYGHATSSRQSVSSNLGCQQAGRNRSAPGVSCKASCR